MASDGHPRRLAVVTGASSGIGFELAKCCARDGMDLLIAADEPRIESAAQDLRSIGVTVDAVQADLSKLGGVDTLIQAIGQRRVYALLANAGIGMGNGFLDQPWDGIHHTIDTNVTGTLYLIHKVGQDMRAQGGGRILITGSIAGFAPGTYQAVYNASKSFLDSFSLALRHEVARNGITVTCLMPGVTETDFFERADMMDTRIGTMKKDDPAMVAEKGFKAMMNGEGDVVTGWHNKLVSAIAQITPAGLLAEANRLASQPGSGRR